MIPNFNRITQAQIGEGLRYLASLSIEFQQEVIQRQNILGRKFRNYRKDGQQVEVEYAYLVALAIAALEMKNFENSMRRKSELSHEEAKKITELRMSRVKKTVERSNKKARIIEARFMELIPELRERGLSWRELSSYLQTYHRFTVSHSYLKRTYEKLARGAGGAKPPEEGR